MILTKLRSYQKFFRVFFLQLKIQIQTFFSIDLLRIHEFAVIKSKKRLSKTSNKTWTTFFAFFTQKFISIQQRFQQIYENSTRKNLFVFEMISILFFIQMFDNQSSRNQRERNTRKNTREKNDRNREREKREKREKVNNIVVNIVTNNQIVDVSIFYMSIFQM